MFEDNETFILVITTNECTTVILTGFCQKMESHKMIFQYHCTGGIYLKVEKLGTK